MNATCTVEPENSCTLRQISDARAQGCASNIYLEHLSRRRHMLAQASITVAGATDGPVMICVTAVDAAAMRALAERESSIQATPGARKADGDGALIRWSRGEPCVMEAKIASSSAVKTSRVFLVAKWPPELPNLESADVWGFCSEGFIVRLLMTAMPPTTAEASMLIIGCTFEKNLQRTKNQRVASMKGNACKNRPSATEGCRAY